MKKRVLQLLGSFNQGGSERQAVALARLLKNDGTFDVFAATLNKDGILRGEIEGLNLPEIPEFPLTSFFNTNFVRQVRRCAKYLKEHEISLVHTHDFYTNVFGMAAAKLAGIEARIASKRETGGMRSRGQELVEKIAFRSAHAVVVNSQAVSEFLTVRGVSAAKTRLIYNGLDLERFENQLDDSAGFLRKNSLPTQIDVHFVTLVANLRHHVKNVPMLLRAAKRISPAKPDTHFVIAGEGELETEFRRLAESLGITENVHFIGRCTDVPLLLSASSICVLTSTAEGFSNSIIEYMAAERPVIATDVGGASEAIEEGVSGYLVTSDDDEALARRLSELLADPDKAKSFGKEGKRIAAAKFSQEAQLQKTLDLYHSLLR